MNGEILDRKNGIVYYQIKDSVFATDINSKKHHWYMYSRGDFQASASITTMQC